MLPARHRMRRSTEFAETIGAGARSSGRYLVVHATAPIDADPTPAVRVGFVVSKAIGNAVVRNRVKRRLRALVAEELPAWSAAGVVIRTRPAAAGCDAAALRTEVRDVAAAAMRRAQARVGR